MTPEEIATAIATIEHSRGTHVEWRDFIQKHPEIATQPSTRTETDIAGDVAHHTHCIAGYDHAIDVLRRVMAEKTLTAMDTLRGAMKTPEMRVR